MTAWLNLQGTLPRGLLSCMALMHLTALVLSQARQDSVLDSSPSTPCCSGGPHTSPLAPWVYREAPVFASVSLP